MHRPLGVAAPLVALMLLLLLLLTTVVPGSHSCPRSCNCYQANEVHCTFRSLLTVPPGLPSHTRRINLGFNSINRIHSTSLAGLTKAELLMLHSNSLQHLPDAAFKDMKSLQILKLSYNKLREISSSLTFSGLTSLLRLYLDHNLLEYIHPRALLQLPGLRLLRLQGNRLHQLHPHTLCTLSLLNTYYFSTLRHLDLSNNTLTTLAKETLTTAPLLEVVMLHANPWSCDCGMDWLFAWSLAHPGLMKCPGGPQCPTCASPDSLQGQGLLDQTDLKCTSSFISFPGRHSPLETEPSEIQTRDTLREPLGGALLGLSDQQGNSVDLSCNITLFSDSQDISNSPDLSLTSSSPIPLALSLSLECPIDRESYEILWRILAYYSETAVHLEREIMLGKEPELAFRYRQVAAADGYYHTGVKAAVKVKPQWLLQPAVSIQLNRAQSNGNKVHLIYATRVSAQPDLHPTTSSPAPHPWVLILANRTAAAFTAVSGTKVELSCPLLSSEHPKVQWILPDGSKLNSPFRIQDGRIQASASGLLLRNVQLPDSGLYYCIAHAGKDIDVLPLRLAVEESSVPPSGEQVAPSITGTVGEPVSLSCNATGSPNPNLTWILPNGNIIHSGKVVSKGLTIQRNGSLSLPNPSAKDAGHYRCIAVNTYGSDALSTMVVFKSQFPPTLKTSFPRGPQSAAGRSTRIRAPLLGQILEGSGDEVEEERSSVANGSLPKNNERPPQVRHPNGSPRRRGPVRNGLLRRKGSENSSTDLRRNRFDTRHRMATNKQRIDPQKWADILAKIRLKTANIANSQATTTVLPTSAPAARDRGTTKDNGVKSLDRNTAEVTVVDADIEGSSVDDSVLQEEGLQPIYPVLTKKRTDTEIDRQIETSTLSQTTKETLTLSTGLNTETKTKTETNTLQPVFESNDIVQKAGESLNPGVDPITQRTRPQKPSLPNLITGARPQNPWNTRRRIGQHRRIINRTRGKLLTPPKPLADPSKHNSQATTPDTTTDPRQMLPLSTTTTQATLLTKNHPISTGPSHSVNILSPHISSSPSVSDSKSVYPSLTSPSAPVTSLSPLHTNSQTQTVSHSADILKTAESTFLDTVTPATTHSNVVIAQTHVLDTHATQTHTNPHTVLGKHIDEPLSKDEERNLLDVSHESNSNSLSSPRLSVDSSTAFSPTTARTTTLRTTLKSSLSTSSVITSTSATTSTTVDETLTTTTLPVTTKQIMSNAARTVYAPLATTSQRTAAPSTTTTTLMPIYIQTTTTPTTTSTIVTTPTTTSTTTSTTVTSPTTTSTTTTIPTTSHAPSTTSPTTTTTTSTSTRPSTTFNRSIKTSDKIILTTRNYSPTSATLSTATTTTAKATTVAPTNTPLTFTTTTSTSTRLVTFREKPSSSRFDNQGRPVPGASSQSQSLPDWRNPGANSIPDSHSSRPHWSPSLPAVPGPSVSRSRPKIADPHIRVVSFPADSTARLTCEAQGEPKPSITWTKVATGAVMSIHSKAQRFEVLPNGTLVIQNVQLQDRGTYICSAQSFLGRDRLLTTLEVWTRPPRMQLASYREATIHQGGEVHLECRADGVPTPLLSWVLPDRSVLTSSAPVAKHISMDTNGTLHISGTLTRDRGMYRCVASNSAGAASSSVRLHVSSLPPVIQQSREEHLLLLTGRSLYAHCSARGAPPPTLRWRIPDGTLVRPSQFLHGNLFVLPNGTLHISRVEPKDSGSYECTASNAVGTDKRTVRVRIQLEAGGETRGGVQKEMDGKTLTPHSSNNRTAHDAVDRTNIFNVPKVSPPVFADRSRTSQISPGRSDPSSNSHTPNFTYSPGNKTVNASLTHSTNIDKPNAAKLQLSNANRPFSPHNTSRISAVLNPMPVSPFTRAQIVSTSPSITSVHYGGFLQLHCSVTGTPVPIIIWRTPVRKLVDVNFSFDSRLKVHPNGTLSIQAVTEKDAGDYLCIARNKVADDYRLLRVSVATQPPKIAPKQPLDQMVSFGNPLKVDCQASGLPDPAVHWSLPDGTMVNSVLQGEDRGGRARRLTVFDNGTLLVPAVGMREEGEYTCYAENQGGQDTMKVKVKVMMSSPPVFPDEKLYRTIKVRQGTTASIPCPARGEPAPTVTWLSPGNRVIPQSLGSGFYFERVVVVSGGTLEIRQAQKIDTGNYTCRASNSAGERNMVVSLEVEPFNYLISGQVGGRSTNVNHAGRTAYGFISGASNNLDAKNSISNGHSDKNSNINIQPNAGINAASSGSNPALRSDHRNGYNRPVSGITTPFGGGVSSVGVTGARSVDIKADDTGSRSNSGIVSGNSVVNSRSTATVAGAEINSGRNFNDVLTGRAAHDDNGQISPASRNVGVSSRAGNWGRETGASRGSWYSRSGYAGIASDDIRQSGRPAVSHSGHRNYTSTVIGVVSKGKHKVVRGTTVFLPCPSYGSPPPRVTWLLPGNGVLPSPYYGSRQTVHRNGTLEVRGVRPTDAGTLVCVVRGVRGDTRIQVELEVSDLHEETRYPHREPAVEKPVQKTVGLPETRHSGATLDSHHSPASVLSNIARLRFPVTQHPSQRGLTLPPAAPPLGLPPQSTSTSSEAAASTRTGSIITIINGEKLHLPCPLPQNTIYDQSSLKWTTPSGNVLSRGESADSGRYSVQEDGTLIVQQATTLDRGTYSCKFTSSDSSSVSVLTVPVIVIAYPPRITKGPSPVTYTRPGVAVELPCLTIATPRATVTWETPDTMQLRTNGQARIYGNRYLSPQGSLVIQKPTSRDTGFYKCTAKNEIGMDAKSTYLHVI